MVVHIKRKPKEVPIKSRTKKIVIRKYFVKFIRGLVIWPPMGFNIKKLLWDGFIRMLFLWRSDMGGEIRVRGRSLCDTSSTNSVGPPSPTRGRQWREQAPALQGDSLCVKNIERT